MQNLLMSLQATLTGGRETGTEEQLMANEDPAQVQTLNPSDEDAQLCTDSFHIDQALLQFSHMNTGGARSKG